MLELDHVIVFLPGSEVLDSLFPGPGGLLLDQGTRHVGQGTRNRRVIFSDCYIELVWVDSPVDAQASGLHFQERCSGAACPFGVVARGLLPQTPGFVEYRVPNGPRLDVLDDLAAPFLAIDQVGDLNRMRPTRRAASEFLNSANQVQHIQIAAARLPGPLDITRVSFMLGAPELTLTLTGMDEPLRLRPGNTSGAGWHWN
jgi:hypothetical protein